MPKSMFEILPDAATVLQLEAEELAGVLIQYLNSLTIHEQRQINRYNFLTGGGLEGYPNDSKNSLELAFAEAWAWLERECLLALLPNASGSYGFFITRRGKKLVDRTAFEAYRRASVLPRALLHPRIESRAYPSFMRGAYDTAVFESFREVEVAVRQASGFGPDKYGRPLMRAAFGPPDGPLIDRATLTSEQESVAELFAGAIGTYKNPTSHRTQLVSDPQYASEIIMLASHLLKLVEVHKSSR